MSAWVDRPSWTAAGPDRRPHLLQGLAIAAAISLGVHFLAMSGSRPILASDARVAAHTLAVRTIVVPAAAAVVRPEPSAEMPAPLPTEPPQAPRARERQAAPERPARERNRREAEGAGGGEATPSPPRATAAEAATTRHAARPVASGYIPAGQLDPPPRPLHDIEPVYPPEAGFRSGKVVLRLLISETGAVDRVDVIGATPPDLFDSAARDAFAAARFSPGRMAGIAVKCEMTIEVEYTPINRGSEVSGSRTY